MAGEWSFTLMCGASSRKDRTGRQTAALPRPSSDGLTALLRTLGSRKDVWKLYVKTFNADIFEFKVWLYDSIGCWLLMFN